MIHGTDTMVQTAQTIKKHATRDKVVVITGAMLPFMKESDAMFNFGGAFIAAQTLEPGIWITMNGHIFKSDDVEKNTRKEFLRRPNLGLFADAKSCKNLINTNSFDILPLFQRRF